MRHPSGSVTRARPHTPPADLAVPTVGEIEAVLRELLADLSPLPTGRGRPAVLPALAVWGGLIVCVLSGWSSQLDLWRLLTQAGLWDYPRFAVSDQAVYHRLARDGTRTLERVFAGLCPLLAARLAPYAQHELAAFASGVYALDATTLDPVARRATRAHDLPADGSRRLPGQLAGLFDVRRQQWVRVEHRPDAAENEKVAARQLLIGLPRWSLLLTDLGYFGFKWFDDLTDAGFYYISRLRRKTSYTLLHVFHQDGETLDALVWLGAYRADQAKHAVRLVQFRQGNVLHQYITNLRDPHTLPLAEVATLYARRWDFEMAAQLVKQHLGLSVWWSSKDVVVVQQVWAVLIVAQVLQALRLEIAGRAGVELFEVSLPLLARWAPRLAARGADPIAVFVERGRAAGFIRPSRRVPIHAPDVPSAAIQPLPVGLVRRRVPRYAERRCA
jgi:hypothetical protein